MLSAARIKELKDLADILGLKYLDLEIADEALTHSSFNFEAGNENGNDYERLEFLGDSVLRLYVSELLYDKYPYYDEGKLTKIRSRLVSDNFLAGLAIKTGIDKYIKLGKHEEKDGGRKKESIKACAMEAMLGAIYKSNGADSVKEFIYELYNDIPIGFDEETIEHYNYKELLQQYTQSQNKDLPEYNLTGETGKAHKREFEVTVSYKGEILGQGQGRTKKEAEKQAAKEALIKLKLIDKEENE